MVWEFETYVCLELVTQKRQKQICKLECEHPNEQPGETFTTEELHFLQHSECHLIGVFQ